MLNYVFFFFRFSVRVVLGINLEDRLYYLYSIKFIMSMEHFHKTLKLYIYIYYYFI